MTFANCPKCGSSNVTTAGVCANCGWTRFPQVMGAVESEEAVYELVGEIEIKVTGKALLEDYKRLLFENRNLKERVAELESTLSANNELLIPALKKRESEIVELSNKTISKLNKRIAELEGLLDELKPYRAYDYP